MRFVGCSIGGAFRKKLVGQNCSLAGYSGMRRHTNKNLNDEMTTKVTVLHCKGKTSHF